jgi:hypothetical protein
MADRHWVGGSGTWSTSDTTHWSATLGGAGGASVPTAADAVFFNSGSSGVGNYTVTCTGTRSCLSLTVSSTTVVPTFVSTGNLTIAGSGTPFSLVGGTGWTATGTITFTSNAGVIVSASGVSFSCSFAFNAVGGTFTLGAGLSTSGTITVTAGAFSTANYTLIAAGISSTSTGSVRSINLGSSSLVMSGSAPISLSATNLTFNAGTSSMTCQGSIPTFAGGSLTFNSVSFTYGAVNTISITGSNTFATLSFAARSSTGINKITLSGNQTITGLLTIGASNTASRRTMFASNSLQSLRTITAGSINTGLSDLDFQNIVFGGGAGTISGTRFGDCGSNGNITFPAPKDVYHFSSGSTVVWSSTSAWSGGITNFPLAQDTVYISTSSGTNGTLTVDQNWNIGTINVTGVSYPLGFTVATGSTSPIIYGDLLFGDVALLTGTGTLIFSGRVPQTIQSDNYSLSFGQSVTLDSPGGSLQLSRSFTIAATKTLTLVAGSLDLQSFTLTTGYFLSPYTNIRSIDFGVTGAITCTASGTVFDMSSSSNFTATGSKTVNITYSDTGTVSVYPGAQLSSAALNFNFTGGSYSLTFLSVSNSTVGSVNFTGFNGTWGSSSSVKIFGNLKLSPTMTLTATASTLTLQPDSGQTVTLTSSGKLMGRPIAIVGGVGSTVKLVGALTMGATQMLTLTSGTFDTDSYNVTAGYLNASGSTARSLSLGSSTVTLNGAAPTNSFSAATSTNLTVSGSGVINVTGTGSKTFAGGGIQTYPTLNQGSAGGTLTITGSNKFANITNTSYTDVYFTGGTTQEFVDFNLNGIDAANRLKVKSSNTTAVTFKKSTPWNVGADSIGMTAVSGFIYSGTNPNYLELEYIHAELLAPVLVSSSRFLAFF